MRILLINPYDPDRPPQSPWPHLGLSLLASHASQLGHTVQIVDYAYTPKAPPLGVWLSEFIPDLCGLTLYTAQMKSARLAVREIRTATFVPIILGGPHVSLYADELAKENLGDWIFQGECDLLFGEKIDQISREDKTQIVSADPPDLSQINFPDFGSAFGSEKMRVYPIQLSRGCPFSCSFCSVKFLSTRTVRYREMTSCLDEITQASRSRRNLREIRIVDDCPTFDLRRFKIFLHEYHKLKLGLPLHIDNLRADRIDEELLTLLHTIGVDHLCIGVESGSQEVFGEIHKGETLDEIIRAGWMIKNQGLRLYTCFIVGLPKSTASAEWDSIRLARSLKPDWIYWNQFQPHKGTAARAWFENFGRVYEEEDKTSLIGLSLSFTEAPCDTPEFPAAERAKLHLTAALATGAYWLNPIYFPRYIFLIVKHRLWGPFLIGLPAALRINSKMLVHKIGIGLTRARRSFRRTEGRP